MADASRMTGVDAGSGQEPVVDDEVGLGEVLSALGRGWKPLLLAPIVAGVMGYGGTYLVEPEFTATTAFLPPQQAQSAATSALASLGNLATLAGGSAAVRTPADQYVALMQSVTVSDRIIEQFKLMSVYDKQYRVDARKRLAENVHIGIGKKDGLITVQVDDTDPRRAAEMANRYVDELRRMSVTIAVTEAQQRRMFFATQMEQARDHLTRAQLALQASGFNPGALKAEPKAAAESYARLRAEATAVEVRLQTLRNALADGTPEVRQQQATLAALRSQLARAEQATDTGDGPDYISKYREFKYQETLFEMFARQYEAARVDESREGALIQVVDVATPPEKKSKPRRGFIAAAAAGAGLVLAAVVVLLSAPRSRRKPVAGSGPAAA